MSAVQAALLILLAMIVVAGSALKAYTSKKLRDIDGLGGVCTYDANDEHPPIARV